MDTSPGGENRDRRFSPQRRAACFCVKAGSSNAEVEVGARRHLQAPVRQHPLSQLLPIDLGVLRRDAHRGLELGKALNHARKFLQCGEIVRPDLRWRTRCDLV